MLKRIAIFLALTLLLTAGKCTAPTVSPSAATDCEAIKRLLYPNCRFRITRAEQSALSEENLTKLNAVKIFFRSCPQYQVCGGK